MTLQCRGAHLKSALQPRGRSGWLAGTKSLRQTVLSKDSLFPVGFVHRLLASFSLTGSMLDYRRMVVESC